MKNELLTTKRMRIVRFVIFGLLLLFAAVVVWNSIPEEPQNPYNTKAIIIAVLLCLVFLVQAGFFFYTVISYSRKLHRFVPTFRSLTPEDDEKVAELEPYCDRLYTVPLIMLLINLSILFIVFIIFYRLKWHTDILNPWKNEIIVYEVVLCACSILYLLIFIKIYDIIRRVLHPEKTGFFLDDLWNDTSDEREKSNLYEAGFRAFLLIVGILLPIIITASFLICKLCGLDMSIPLILFAIEIIFLVTFIYERRQTNKRHFSSKNQK